MASNHPNALPPGVRSRPYVPARDGKKNPADWALMCWALNMSDKRPIYQSFTGRNVVLVLTEQMRQFTEQRHLPFKYVDITAEEWNALVPQVLMEQPSFSKYLVGKGKWRIWMIDCPFAGGSEWGPDMVDMREDQLRGWIGSRLLFDLGYDKVMPDLPVDPHPHILWAEAGWKEDFNNPFEEE